MNLSTENPGRPRITQYDADSRIELSGRVLTNWTHKAANLLVEEFDAGVGTTVVIDLPAGSWRAVYWALATWLTGACVVAVDSPTLPPASASDDDPVSGGGHASHAATGSGAAARADVVITHRPSDWQGQTDALVAVELAALARAFSGELAGALDEAATLASYDDFAPDCPNPSLDDKALSFGSTTMTYRQVHTDLPPDRMLLLVSEYSTSGEALAFIVGVLCAGGSLVIAPDGDPSHVARLSATEHAIVAPT